jgi:hypothetical protein
MWPFNKSKPKPKKLFDLGISVATLHHRNGHTYQVTRKGYFETMFEEDDIKYTSKELISYHLDKKRTLLVADCGTVIPVSALDRITIETKEYKVEGIDYGI